MSSVTVEKCKKKRKTKPRVSRTVNSLLCSIPGLKNPMLLNFPKGKLPVCDKCKRIFKTRELCRERDGHTNYPWTKTYICFIVDDSCFEIDENTHERRLVKQDGPNPYKFYATETDCSPTKYNLHFEVLNGKVQDPICTPCKTKNYTKNYCRIRHEHQHLPWGTIYMTLKAERGNEETQTMEEDKVGSKRHVQKSNYDPVAKRMRFEDSDYHVPIQKEDIYNNTENSSAFLLIVSGGGCELKWLKENNTETETAAIEPGEITSRPETCSPKFNSLQSLYGIDELKLSLSMEETKEVLPVFPETSQPDLHSFPETNHTEHYIYRDDKCDESLFSGSISSFGSFDHHNPQFAMSKSHTFEDDDDQENQENEKHRGNQMKDSWPIKNHNNLANVDQPKKIDHHHIPQNRFHPHHYLDPLHAQKMMFPHPHHPHQAAYMHPYYQQFPPPSGMHPHHPQIMYPPHRNHSFYNHHHNPYVAEMQQMKHRDHNNMFANHGPRHGHGGPYAQNHHEQHPYHHHLPQSYSYDSSSKTTTSISKPGTATTLPPFNNFPPKDNYNPKVVSPTSFSSKQHFHNLGINHSYSSGGGESSSNCGHENSTAGGESRSINMKGDDSGSLLDIAPCSTTETPEFDEDSFRFPLSQYH